MAHCNNCGAKLPGRRPRRSDDDEDLGDCLDDCCPSCGAVADESYEDAE